MTPYVNGTFTQIAPVDDTPDFRIEEPHYLPMSKIIEHERPYLNSPPYKNFAYYSKKGRDEYQARMMEKMGCYCNTVYRRLTLLAGCAVITTRHILTTATPTMLVVRSYRHEDTLDGIFGGWYDTNADAWNSSAYFKASRIHVHPQYTYDYEVNVSHPIPAMYDLALVTLQINVWSSGNLRAYICNRAGSQRFPYSSTIPGPDDVSIIAGFQFIKAYNRRPKPWFRYIVHTKQHIWPCPKSDWQWFHCIYGEYWGRYGFDSGGGMNSAWKENWRTNGLSGLCAFSLKLRSKQTVHYFTVVDNWPVLDFLYDAMLGLIKCAWLDNRFQNTKWDAPVPWKESSIEYDFFNVPLEGQVPFY